ncbi:MAG TPA: alpha-(1-_3)-arabinofuranosyltransferase family protein [Acidimicrobiales bacterium]
MTARGVVAADTKQYLYLDVGRYLRGASTLWDPSMFGGWVTHQTIGYLWPLGPWYWVMDRIGVPVWVAQRLWIGTLVFAAGTGILVLARLLRVSWPGAVAAAALYGLSPYLLGYVNRTSVLLSPWAGLGWMMATTILAARRGGWRWPAAFALVVATVGGVNATALVLCGLAPVLWLAHAAWISHEIPVRRVLATAGRIAVLTVAASAWWIVALAVQARYGADVLAYSETVSAVSSTSLASEITRALGYWLFYGGDIVGRWNSASTVYLENPGLIGLGFALAAVAVLAIVFVRWRDRVWLAALVLVGLVVSVGAHPFDDPSPFGRLIKSSAENTLVLALRSSTRALPLLLVAFALGVGVALTAFAVQRPRPALYASAAVVVLAVVNLPTLWNGTYVDALLRRPATIPGYWQEAADALTANDDGSRALELPGAEFAAYRWGTTTDAILPGLTDRPTLTRDLLPLGSAGAMDLLNALDNRFQAGVVEPAAIAPVARLLGAGAIVYRGDTAFERYRTPRPEPTWSVYASGTPGLGPPTTFGTPTVNEPAVPMLDETALSDPRVGQPVPPAAVVPVTDAQPVIRAHDASAVTVVDGSGDGLVDAAAAGLLDNPGTVLQSGAFPDPAALRAAVPAGAPLIVTDTNRKRAEQWRGSQDTTGFTEAPNGPALLVTDDADHRLPLFPGTGTAFQTVALQEDGATAVASAYGEPTAYRPEDRADQAVDGDVATAWKVADRAEAIGERLRVTLPAPTDHLTVVQPHDRQYNRWITRLGVDAGGRTTTVDLADASRTDAGQRIDLPAPATSVDLEVAATNTGRLANYFGIDAVGLAEVRADGVAPTREVVRPPQDLLAALGADSPGHPLSYVLSRLRVDERNRWRDDPEQTIVRSIQVPTARPFTVSGSAHLTARLAPDLVAADLFGTAPVATATSVLTGVITAGARSAVDGDPATSWQTAFDDANGAAITVHSPSPLTVDHLDLQVLNDGRHSVPRTLTAAMDGQAPVRVDLPDVPEQPGPVAVPVPLPPLTGQELTVTIDSVDARYTTDRRYGDHVMLPVAIAELGVPGFVAPPLPATFDTGCADGLTVDGTAVPIRVRGETAAALAGGDLTVEGCGPVSLTAGDHLVQTSLGSIALDRIVLSSPAPGGEAAAPPAAPTVRVRTNDRTHRVVDVTAAAPVWLTLGEGFNEGWHASAGGHDLGSPRMVDGGFNGWLVPPAPGGGPVRVSLTWEPQRTVDVGLLVSIVGGVVCLVLLAIGSRWERPLPEAADGIALASPLAGSGPSLATWEAAVAAVVVGLATAFVLSPPWAVALGVAAFVSARWRRWRFVVSIGAVAGVVLVGVLYVARQIVSKPQPGFGWVTRFEFAHRIAFGALLLLVVDAVVEHRRSRRASGGAQGKFRSDGRG